ncbi:NlpC/P60 family protein [Guptibacillus hwajinpoensis]|uniref:C40 family peptidase n=1 Tax=Guptibacillus hwajinpoensis TaxID=208199 RepID=UPI001CD264C8|nr:NlpC/P60 family protein [Pseudalkalibacillus hwajinpoensis]MCA0990293.1 NlpC/P60 family protein [Pseudalkalibacillus hwajinpoensis]
MNKSRLTARIASSTLVAAMVFSPVLSDGAFAKVDSNEVKQSDSVSSSSNNVLNSGDRSEAVTALQTELESLGYYTYNVDGIFGQITEDAVEDFQEEKGLTVDGIAGPEVMGALSANDNSEATEPTSDEAPTESVSESDVVSTAKSLIGTPYVWGGTTPDGFDSSGFIQYVFNEAGVDISRTERDMWKYDGTEVESPAIGDVVFFEGTYDVEGASHSGIYIGDNKIIHAGSGGVEVTDLSYDFWQDHYLGVKSFK